MGTGPFHLVDKNRCAFDYGVHGGLGLHGERRALYTG